jgi:DNA-binding NarL/FixJ family response regulator
MRTVLAEGQATVRDALRILVTQGLGMQVVDEARTLQTLQRQVRVVVVGLRPEMRPAALAAGADDFFSKVDAPEVVVGVLQDCPKAIGETTGGLS